MALGSRAHIWAREHILREARDNSWRAMSNHWWNQSFGGSRYGSVTTFSGLPFVPRITFAPRAAAILAQMVHSSMQIVGEQQTEAFPFRALPPRRFLLEHCSAGIARLPLRPSWVP